MRPFGTSFCLFPHPWLKNDFRVFYLQQWVRNISFDTATTASIDLLLNSFCVIVYISTYKR